MVKIKSNLATLIQRNKVELLKDPRALDKIEKKIEEKIAKDK